jgi:hypothetical protein
MEKIKYIFGFMKMLSIKSAPVAVILVDEDGGHEMVYPGGKRRKISSLAEEQEVRGLDHFILSEGEPLVWKDGQTAYLDHGGTVHVGTALETIEVIKKDVVNIKDMNHRNGLSLIAKALQDEAVSSPSSL